MATTPLRLKDGINPQQILDQVPPLITQARNVIGRGVGVNAATDMREAYLMWVEDVEVRLRSLTRDPHLASVLQTTRHWRIRELGPGSPRPFPLIQAEIDVQREWLEGIVEDVRRRMAHAASAPGHPTVLDTHVLLHFEPPEMIPWPTVLKQPAVRLIVPLRVVEELDAKKYARRDDLAGRARRILPQLERCLGSGGGPGQVREGVTIEVPPVGEGRIRFENADEEILGVAEELRQFGQQQVSLVTADTAMRIRAQAHGVDVAYLPAEYERRRASEQKA